jgi:hypothetical protein
MNGNRSPLHLWVSTQISRSIFALLIASACADTDGPSRSETSVADSAGVRIVQFAADVDSPSLRLSDESAVTISSDDGAAFQLHRVTDAAFLPDGGLAVANAGESEVLVFEASGQLVRRLGGSGDGPGEFRALRWVAVRPPDTMVAIDLGLRRVTLFEPGGAVARVVDAAGGSADAAAIGEFAPQPIGMLGDGSVVMASYTSLPAEPGLVRRHVELIRFRSDLAVHESLGSTPSDELHLLLEDGRLQVLTPPFARSTVIRVGPDGYFVGDTDRPEIRGYGPQGDLRAVVRWQGTGQRVTDEVLDADIRYRFRSLEGPAFEQRLTEQRRISTHLTTPAFRSMLVGSDGLLWIGRHALVSDSVVAWFGIEPVAGTVSSVYLPTGMEPLAIRQDEIAVLVRDELDTESVRRYRLEKR